MGTAKIVSGQRVPLNPNSQRYILCYETLILPKVKAEKSRSGKVRSTVAEVGLSSQ